MKIKLIILDVDGVLTDGTKTYDNSGRAKYKNFCDKDFTAIKKAKSSGVSVCFLSGDRTINQSIAENRDIDFYYARGKSKSSFVPIFSEKYNCDLSEMAFIGDDLFDLDLLEIVGFSASPSDACKEVLDSVNLVLHNKGGQNLVMELVQYLYSHEMIPPFSYTKLLDLDKQEKF